MPHIKVNATPVKHFNRNDGTYLDKENFLGVIESFVGPVAYISSLWAVAYYYQGRIDSSTMLLTILVFPLVYPDKTSFDKSVCAGIINLLVNYLFTATVLLATGLLTGYITAINKSVLYAWALFAPIANISIYIALRSSAKSLVKIHGHKRRGIIIGMNAQGIALAKKIEKSLYSRIDIIGFLDNRLQHRDTLASPYKLIGEMNNLADIIKFNSVQVIYLSLPMASQPRIHQILDTLKDTTASIYFVPDMLMTDLIQGHSSLVCGTPVISVCETPFKWIDGITKLLSDLNTYKTIHRRKSDILNDFSENEKYNLDFRKIENLSHMNKLCIFRKKYYYSKYIIFIQNFLISFKLKLNALNLKLLLNRFIDF
jgi:putative colanic acid biosynthesis UDP-glucose lipid carrier transferase